MLPLKAVPSSSTPYSGGTNRHDRSRRGERGQVAHHVGQVDLDHGGERPVDALSELVLVQVPLWEARARRVGRTKHFSQLDGTCFSELERLLIQSGSDSPEELRRAAEESREPGLFVRSLIGTAEARILYESPFTDLGSRGPDALFAPEQFEELLWALDAVRSTAIAA
jgi:hypothetical protein